MHELRHALLGGLRPSRHGGLEVPLQVGDAALPGASLQLARYGRHKPRVGVGDHEPDAREPPCLEARQEAVPALLALGVHGLDAQDVLAPVRSQPDRRHHGVGGDDGALPAAHVGGVQPEVAAGRPGEVAAPQGLHLGVQLAAEPRDLRARQRGDAEPLGDPLHLPGRDPRDVHLPHERGHRHVHPRPAGEHLLGEVGALPQLGDPQLDVARRRLQGARPVAVPAVGAGLRALAPGRPAGELGLLVHHRVHDQRQDPAGELAGVAALVPEPLEVEGLLEAHRHYTLIRGHRLPFIRYLSQRRIVGDVPPICPGSRAQAPRSPPALTPHLCALPLAETAAQFLAPERDIFSGTVHVRWCTAPFACDVCRISL